MDNTKAKEILFQMEENFSVALKKIIKDLPEEHMIEEIIWPFFLSVSVKSLRCLYKTIKTNHFHDTDAVFNKMVAIVKRNAMEVVNEDLTSQKKNSQSKTKEH